MFDEDQRLDADEHLQQRGGLRRPAGTLPRAQQTEADLIGGCVLVWLETCHHALRTLPHAYRLGLNRTRPPPVVSSCTRGGFAG